MSVGDTMLTAVAEATAVCLPFLPRPHPLHIQRNLHVLDDEDRYLVALQVPLTLIPTPTLITTLYPVPQTLGVSHSAVPG